MGNLPSGPAWYSVARGLHSQPKSHLRFQIADFPSRVGRRTFWGVYAGFRGFGTGVPSGLIVLTGLCAFHGVRRVWEGKISRVWIKDIYGT